MGNFLIGVGTGILISFIWNHFSPWDDDEDLERKRLLKKLDKKIDEL